MAEVKNLGGRPSDFDEKKIKKVLGEYLNEAVPQNMKFPTVEGLALKLDVTKKTLYNWTKKSKWFLHSIRKLKMLQKEYLIETGVFGGKEVNPTIIAMMLRVNHKMVETTKSESNVKVQGVIPLLKNVSDNEFTKETVETEEKN